MKKSKLNRSKSKVIFCLIAFFIVCPGMCFSMISCNRVVGEMELPDTVYKVPNIKRFPTDSVVIPLVIPKETDLLYYIQRYIDDHQNCLEGKIRTGIVIHYGNRNSIIFNCEDGNEARLYRDKSGFYVGDQIVCIDLPQKVLDCFFETTDQTITVTGLYPEPDPFLHQGISQSQWDLKIANGTRLNPSTIVIIRPCATTDSASFPPDTRVVVYQD